MMTKILLGVFLKENFSFRRILGFDAKKSKAKAILIILAMVYALAVFIGLFGYLFFDLGKVLKEMNQMRLLLSFAAIYAIGLSIIIVLFRADGTLFHTKDYEILSPLPIPNKTILRAKVLILYLMVITMAFLATAPILFAYFYHNGVSVFGLLAYLIGFLVLPLVPFIIMSFLSLLISRITARMRHTNLIKIVVLFVLVIALMLASFSINDPEINPLTGQIDLFKGISDLYLPFAWFMDAVHDQSLVALLLLVASHIGAFYLYIEGISGIAHKSNQASRNIIMSKTGKVYQHKQKSVTRTLVEKELNTFLSIPLYALNAGLGPIILLIFSIASLFYQEGIQNVLQEMIAEGLDTSALILILVGFSIAMTYTPAISLSLEGKRFWIVKSLPIRTQTLIMSKVLFNVALIAPIALLSTILFTFSFAIPFMSGLLMMVLALIFSVLISLFDATVNLFVPKFDFINPVEVIKQSAGALLAVFGGFAWLAMSGFIWYLLAGKIDETWIMVLLITFNLILSIPFYLLIHLKSDDLVRKMNA